MTKAISKDAENQGAQVAVLVSPLDLEDQHERIEYFEGILREVRTVMNEVNMNHDLDASFVRSVMGLSVQAITGACLPVFDDAIAYSFQQRKLAEAANQTETSKGVKS